MYFIRREPDADHTGRSKLDKDYLIIGWCTDDVSMVYDESLERSEVAGPQWEDLTEERKLEIIEEVEDALASSTASDVMQERLYDLLSAHQP